MVPQNSGELVYSQVVALTVIALKVKTIRMANTTAQRTGRRKPNNHLLNLLKFSSWRYTYHFLSYAFIRNRMNWFTLGGWAVQYFLDYIISLLCPPFLKEKCARDANNAYNAVNALCAVYLTMHGTATRAIILIDRPNIG